MPSGTDVTSLLSLRNLQRDWLTNAVSSFEDQILNDAQKLKQVTK